MTINIRKGTKEDLAAVLQLIQELADYENASNEVAVTVESMEKDGFGDPSFFQFLVAETNDSQQIVGTAVYFHTYSTWKGRVLYLEDLVVNQAYRRKGIGKQLFDNLIAIANEMNAQRLCWQVLDWNTPAIEFYKTIETNFDAEWINCKLTAAQLRAYSK